MFAVVGFSEKRVKRWLTFGKRKPELDILWKPGEETYHFPYPLPPGQMNLQYRLCVFNNTSSNLTNVRVTLDKLSPYALRVVPCSLRAMHDNEPPYPTSFTLQPHGRKFIDLMLQWPDGDKFWIFHTMTDVQSWVVPAQGYDMTIKVEADDTEPAEKSFRLEKNGSLWNLIEGGSKTPPIPASLPQPAERMANPASGIKIREEWHRLENEFGKYSPTIWAMFEFYPDEQGGDWSLIGADDYISQKGLEATMKEAGNLLFHSSFRLPQSAANTDPTDRWITTAAALVEYPIEWSGETTGTAVKHSRTAVIKEISKVSVVACKQLAAMDVERPIK